MANEIILTVLNNHIESCGKPPAILADGTNYVSYFENKRGEQAIFIYDLKKDKAVIRMGDAGWENEYEVLLDEGRTRNLTLESEEQIWLRACAEAIGPRRKYKWQRNVKV